jgi:hypothetical protein
MNTKHVIGYTATALVALGIGAASGSADQTAPVAAGSGTTATATVTAPGPEVTVTAPPVTETVEVPGPTKTVKVGPPPPAVAMPGDGTFQVGVDVKAGTYVSKASPTGNCYWARLKNSGGGFDAIIANGNSAGQVVVTIRKTDKFFESSGCSDWTKR